MGKGLHSSPPGPVQRGRTDGHQAATDGTVAAPRAAPRRGPLRRAAAFVRDYLPRGDGLDQETFRRRHLLLCWILGLHIPALFAFGVWQGFGVDHAALEVAVPLACLAFARVATNRRVAGFFVTAGLVYCSSALVHLSNGNIEAHFHFFILIGLIALYQDWVPFLWNVMFTVLSHGLGSGIASDVMYNHPAAQQRPWHWAVVHGVAVLAACVGVIIFWKNTEREQQRNLALVADMAAAEAEQRAAVSALLVNLARRNQSLLNRQLGVISELEQRERQPEVLDELFTLDHLATRIRRNAESLLVLSGDEPSRLWSRPVPLPEVVRAAAAEVEEYRRVDVQVNDHLEVAGKAVADLAHLLAELVENATTFSPPNRQVLVRSHLGVGEPRGYVVSVEDVGIGMSDDELARANDVLAHAPEVDLRRSTMLGFHVVARLAARYGITVSVAPTPGGGLTALVRLPDELVTVRTPAAVVAGGPAVEATAFVPVEAPAAPFPPVEPAATFSRPHDLAPAFVPPVEPAPAPGFVPPLEPTAAPAFVPPVEPAVEPVAFAPPPAPTPPAPTSLAPTSPAEPPPAPAPAPAGANDGPLGAVRRVPGASLARALRSNGGPAGDGAQAAPAADPPPADAGGPPRERDPERVRSMLSRFQNGQRAGRAVSTLHAQIPDDPGSRPSQEDR